MTSPPIPLTVKVEPGLCYGKPEQIFVLFAICLPHARLGIRYLGLRYFYELIAVNLSFYQFISAHGFWLAASAVFLLLY